MLRSFRLLRLLEPESLLRDVRYAWRSLLRSPGWRRADSSPRVQRHRIVLPDAWSSAACRTHLRDRRRPAGPPTRCGHQRAAVAVEVRRQHPRHRPGCCAQRPPAHDCRRPARGLRVLAAGRRGMRHSHVGSANASRPLLRTGYRPAETRSDDRAGRGRDGTIARDIGRRHPADYVQLAETDEACAWLLKAYDERSSRLAFMAVDPVLDSLRSHPCFQDILRRMGLVAPPA